MMKHIMHLLIGLIPLLLLSALLYWLITTSTGLSFVVSVLPRFIPGHLSVQQVQGTLQHEIILQDVSYQNELLNFSAKTVDIRWLPSQLIDHNIVLIQNLLISNGQIQIKQTKPSTEKTWPHLPVNIIVQNASIKQYTLILNQQKLLVTNGNLQAQYQFKYNNYQFNWQLSGNLHNYPMHSDGSISLNPKSINLSQFELNSSDSKIVASGELDTQWQGQWQIDIKNLQHFLPNSSGQLESNGVINGYRATPIIQAAIQAQHLHYQEYQLNNLQSHFIIDPTLQKPWQIQMLANGLQFKNYTIDKLSLSSQSTLNQQQIQLHLQQSDKQLSVLLKGQLQNKIWLGQLQQLQMTTNKWGNWQLQKSSDIKITANSAQIGNTTLQSTRGNISGSGNWQKEKSWSAQLSADHFALQNLNFLLPDSIQLLGQLQLTASASQNIHQTIIGQVQLNLNNGAVLYPYNQQQQTLHLQNGQAKINMGQNGISSTWQFNLSPQQGLSGDVNLPNYQIGKPLLTHPISGHIHVNPIPLQLLQPFIPNTKNLSGTLNINSTIQGTVAKPVILGQLVLNNGQVTIPSLNITLNNIQINAKGQPNSTIQYTANARSGDGQLLISGNTDLQKPGFFSLLQIQGKQLLVINTSHYQIYASPQLSAQIQNREIHLTGSIFIPQATLAPPDYKRQSVVLPDDVVFVNQKQENNTPSYWNYYSQVELDLGDKINVNVLGLQGKLLGNIQLNDVPQRPTTANGTLSVKNATYEAYGQHLDVNSGRLIFTGGPLNNPGVAIQASRQVTTTTTSNMMTTGISNLPSTGNSTLSSITAPFFNQENTTRVGINVQGTLKDPQITLFSDPATLSQADILSYLLFNQPSSQVSTANAQLLMQAASSMNLGGGQLQQVTNQLQKTFGLTQLSVGTSTYYNPQTASMMQNTSVMMGKKITPRLYINYSVGLTAPINILQISYLLTSHWTLQSSTSTLANGIDLLYSFEHD